MASRSLRVEFVPENRPNEVASDPQVHDVSIPADTVGAPQFLENPHVDFPGLWALVDDDDLTTGVPADPRDAGSVDRDLVDRGLADTAPYGDDVDGTRPASTGDADTAPATAVAAGSATGSRTAPGAGLDDADRVYRYARAADVATTNDTTAVG